MREVHDYLNSHLDQKITIDKLAMQFHINTTTLKQAFREVYGMSIAAHMRKHRMEKAADLLSSTSQSIQEIAARVGYSSQSRFALVFREEYGITPTEYRLTHRIYT